MSLAPALMIQGTASGVGKSWLVAALCRVFARRGIRVAPFKAQNMSNNAAVTAGGGEVGRAQALQASASGLDVDERMNPVLIKPMADTRSAVIVEGRHAPSMDETPWHDRPAVLWPVIRRNLADLRRDSELVLIEGAGSPAEINLRRSDLVNMAVAHEASASVLLVADIDRGGAFASLYGTWSLLDLADRALVRGFVLNRFRGDPALLEPGPEELQSRTGVPVLGVVPFVRHLLPEEDAAASWWIRDPDPTPVPSRPPDQKVRIAAIRFPHVSNLDDVDPLRAHPAVELVWATSRADLEGVAAVVLPGSRNTVADLDWLRLRSIDSWLKDFAASGGTILGICGGLQMLGDRVSDPTGIECAGERPGLGLLSVVTRLEPAKTTRRCRATVVGAPFGLTLPMGIVLAGYEIHHGSTSPLPGARVWLLEDRHRRALGVSQRRTIGVYVHGILENEEFRDAWLRSLGVRTSSCGTWGATLEREIDRVADVVEGSLPIETILSLARETAP